MFLSTSDADDSVKNGPAGQHSIVIVTFLNSPDRKEHVVAEAQCVCLDGVVSNHE